MKMNVQKIYKTVCLLIIALFCVRATTLNLKPELFIGGDIGVRTVFPMQTLNDAAQMWCSNEGPGRDNTYSTTYIALSLFLIFLKIMGFSQIVFTKIFFFLLLFMAGATSYFLVLHILDGKNGKGFTVNFCSLIGALFYTFNYFSRTLFNNPSGHQPIVYSFFPLAFLLFIKGLDSEKRKLYYAILFGFVSILIFSCNLAHVGAAIIILALYFVFHIFKTKRFWRSFQFALPAGIFSLLLCAFIIFPMVSSLGLQENLQRNVDLGWFNIGSWLYSNSYFLDLFRTDGAVTYPPNFPIDKPVFIFFGYILPIISFSSLFWIKKNKYAPFFILLSLIGIFLAKGCQYPFPQIFYYIGKIFPPFTIFKYSYDKFSMLITLSYAVMASFALKEILEYRIGRHILQIIIIPVIVCISWPFIIGGIATGSFFPKIPDSYYKHVDYVNSMPDDFKIISLPPTDGNYVYYNWGYFGSDLSLTLLNKPTVESARILNDVLRKLLKYKSRNEFYRVLRILNVKYVLLHEDANINLYDTICEKIKNIILRKNMVSDSAVFGKLDVFKINRRFFRPHIYASNTPVLIISDDKDAVYPLSYSKCFRSNPALFFSKDIKKLKRVIRENPNVRDVVYFKDNISSWLEQIQHIKGANPGFLKETNNSYVFKGNGEFNIEKDGMYKIKAVVSAEPYLTRKKVIGQYISFGNLDNLKINPCNTSYDVSVDALGLLSMQVDFNGAGEEDEYAQMQINNFGKIDISQYPYFYLTYKVDNSEIQTIEVVMEIDTDGDGKADDTLKGLYPIPASQKMSKYVIDVYELAKMRCPDKKQYEVIGLELYPHKLWGKDCSQCETKRRYGFWIREAGFYGCPQVSGRYIVFDSVNLMEELDSWKFDYFPLTHTLKANAENKLVLSREEPKGEIFRDLRDIDINKFSTLDIVYQIQNQEAVKSAELILGLNEKGDILLSDLPVAAGLNRYTVDISEKLNNMFPDMEKYSTNKIKFRINLNSGCNNAGDIFLLKNAALNYRVFRSSDSYHFKRQVFGLDGNNISFARKFKAIEDAKNTVFSKRFFLKKGMHYIRNLVGENLDFVIVEPETKGKNNTQPKTEIRKINSTRYEVNLKTDSPCWLIFSESFDPKWKAYMYNNQRPATSGQRLSWSALLQMWEDRGKRIELKEHYNVNGYANAWHVPEIQNKEINIVIEYIPQRFFELGCIISGLSLCAGGVLLLWIRRKRIF